MGQVATSRRPVFLYQRILPHYRVPIFRLLNEGLRDALVVCHGRTPRDGYLNVTAGNLPDKLGFRHLDLGNRWWLDGRLLWQDYRRPFRLNGIPAAVISEGGPRQLSLIPLTAHCRAAGIPVILWNHAGSRKRNVVLSWDPRDLVHRGLHRLADAFLCYTEDERDLLARHVDSRKLFVARNTVECSRLFRLRRQLEKEGREAVRARLGLTSGRWLLFLGSLVPEKRAVEVVEVAACLRKAHLDARIVVVGDGPEREALEHFAQARLPDARFAGAIHDPEHLASYLFAADVLLLPGYVGLAVNHALSLGLPVVARARGPQGPFHSPEIAHVRDGETGRLATGAGIMPLAEAVRDIVADRSKYAQRCVAYAEARLHERHMVNAILRSLEFVGARVPRGTQTVEGAGRA